MRFGRIIAAFLAFGLISAPVLTAPIDEEFDPPRAEASAKTGDLSVRQAPRPPKAGSLADGDGNRLSGGLEAILAGKAGADKVDVIVTFSGSGSAASAQAAVGAFSVSREFSLISGFAATMTAVQARALSRASGVFRVQQNGTAYASLEVARRDFGVDALLADPADPASQHPVGAGIDVCIVDTGVQGNHEQFTDATTGVSRVVGFVDLIGDYNGVVHSTAYDDHGHGTHVTGIVGGDGTAGTDAGADPVIAPLSRGVAPGVTLHMVKALDYNGAGPTSGVVVGIEWCVAQGADVINLSLGDPSSSDGKDAMSLAVDAAVDQGIVVVAAGNVGDAPGSVSSPGAAVKAITVGAVAEHSASTINSAHSHGVYPAPWSGRGPTADGRIKPDIAAPGVSILSAMSSVVAEDPDPFFGGGGIFDLGCGVGCYIIVSGTSMASPFVAGTAALMLEADATSTLTPAAVRQILADTALERGTAGKDNVFGHGLVDVQAAVRAVQGIVTAPTAFPHTVFRHASVPKSGAVRIPIAVVDMAKPLAITVAIDGRLARSGWKPDIDMILLDEFGEPFLINNPFYPWFSSEPFIPAPGTSSTCPAGEDCGSVGTQETIHIHPSAQKFIIELYAFDGWPNNGAGGDVTVELSNGYVDNALVADAGADGTFKDEDGDGFAEVILDGRASTGLVTGYQWEGAASAEGAVATATLPLGTHTFTLTVTDGTNTSTDTVVVTVGPAGGKPCNPRREVCT